MTRAEAVALYQSGFEPTVAMLLELAAANEQVRQQLQKLMAHKRKPAPYSTPMRPAGASTVKPGGCTACAIRRSPISASSARVAHRRSANCWANFSAAF